MTYEAMYQRTVTNMSERGKNIVSLYRKMLHQQAGSTSHGIGEIKYREPTTL